MASQVGIFHSLRSLLPWVARKTTMGPWFEPEIKILDRLVKPGDTVMDVGANVGVYTSVLSRLVAPSGCVVAYEPIHRLAEGLRRFVRVSGITNVTVREVGLSASPGQGYLAAPRDFSGRLDDQKAHLTDRSRSADFAIALSTLDEEVRTLNLSRLDFVKCDVEGAEYAVFRGGARSLSQFHPTVLAEIEPQWTARCGLTTDEVKRYLQSLGHYRIEVVERAKLVPSAAAKESHRNFIFIPDSSTEGPS